MLSFTAPVSINSYILSILLGVENIPHYQNKFKAYDTPYINESGLFIESRITSINRIAKIICINRVLDKLSLNFFIL